MDKAKHNLSAPLSLAPPKVESETLLGKARAIVIIHNGRDYCLRVTQNGKLILTA